jgi:hypothetical protein
MRATARQKIGAVVVGLALAFVGLEVALRVLNLGYGSSPEESDPYLHHVHPANYAFVQREPDGAYGGYEVEYNAERRIYRGRTAPAIVPPASAASCRVAIMGDSFAEGLGVPFAQSYAGLLQWAARDRCTVRDYGTRSYSPAIYLVQWTRVVSPWKPTHVFLMIYSNDVSDDRTYLASAALGPDGFPTAIRGPRGGWLTSQLRKLYVARVVRSLSLQLTWAWRHRHEDKLKIGGVVEENPRWASPTTDLVLELNRRVRASGSHLVLTVVPSRYKLMGAGDPGIRRDLHDRVKAWAQSNDIEFVDLEQAFARARAAGVALFFRRDIHFTAEGHALTASVIGRAHPELFSRWASIQSRAVAAAFPAPENP